MKFDREVDAIEWTKDPDAYTFKPEILGDKRVGKPQLTFAQLKMQKQNNQELVPIEYREQKTIEEPSEAGKDDSSLTKNQLHE